MPRTLTLILTPRQAADPKCYTALAAHRLGLRDDEVALVRVVRRSIDARRRRPEVSLTLEVYADCEPQPAPVHFDYPDVAGRPEVLVVGSGPAGLFAGQLLSLRRVCRPLDSGCRNVRQLCIQPAGLLLSLGRVSRPPSGPGSGRCPVQGHHSLLHADSHGNLRPE